MLLFLFFIIGFLYSLMSKWTVCSPVLDVATRKQAVAPKKKRVAATKFKAAPKKQVAAPKKKPAPTYKQIQQEIVARHQAKVAKKRGDR